MPFATTTRTRLALTTAAALLAAGAPAAYAALGDPAPAPATTTNTTVAVEGEAYLETRLLFGTERPDGGPAVTDAQFMAFVDREVTPAFPEGLTVQDGRGQWRDASGRIERERSYELTLLYPASQARERHPRIERIRGAYARAFGQESVARLDERTTADF
ncbi:DUF3574 domain-containing protein [Streptomyces ficellus]|uniref:DUF3574 domain-containing protein n=1 Tax=Streptomyces ficellus TaxID=1977088 RepID=A0A6I6FV46_9ACTN|nr:DUF3574 domain-containing protein [Streptomyces ficellus]QGV81426.1 DUF3574 domain-containing protein [Streptomyces ficellus]